MKVKEYMNQNRLEPGMYKLHILDVTPNNETLKGDRMIAIKWEEDNGEGVVWDNLAVTQGAAWKMGQLWVALGDDDEDEVGDPNEFADKLLLRLGEVKEVYAVIGEAVYQGVTRSKVIEYKLEEVGKVLSTRQARVDSGEEEPVPF